MSFTKIGEVYNLDKEVVYQFRRTTGYIQWIGVVLGIVIGFLIWGL